jgi:protein-serine/threonine kinase
MLAGYLPFDDDPANPEGDNINLLYKYIVSTPLTFPEYVTPHARDLLRRILVPDPRKRADLFEVARHSWLSEYAHLVGFITSTTTTSADIAESSGPIGKPTMSKLSGPCSAAYNDTEDQYDVPQIARSASVREPSKPSHVSVPGGLGTKSVPINDETKTPRDAKRRTVQLEYVAPQSQTARQQPISASLPASVVLPSPPSQGRSRARGDSTGGPVAVDPAPYDAASAAQRSQQQRPATAMSPPVRPNREPTRAATDSTPFSVGSPSSIPTARPATSGTRLPSRGNSYGQPAAATVAPTNAEGRFSQPKSSGYIISGRSSQDGSKRNSYTGRPVSQHLPADYQPASQQAAETERMARAHRRSNTVEGFTTKLFGRSNSRRQSATPQEIATARQEREKASRMYPPVSMKNAMPHSGEDLTRPSTESSRRSFGYSRKNSDTAGSRSSRRFSFLPMSFSRMSFSGASGPEAPEGRRASVQANARSRPVSKQSPTMAFGQGRSRSPSQSTTSSNVQSVPDSNSDGRRKMSHQPVRGATAPDLLNIQDSTFSQQPQVARPQQVEQQHNDHTAPQSSAGRSRQEKISTPSQSAESQVSESIMQTPRQKYPAGFTETEPVAKPQHRQPAVLQKNRKFGHTNEGHASSGSSGGARRVMDWFRNRGKERSN